MSRNETDQAVEKAIDSVLNDRREQWINEGGMTRVGNALRAKHAEPVRFTDTAPHRERTESMQVRIEAIRCQERTSQIQIEEPCKEFVETLIEDPQAFAYKFDAGADDGIRIESPRVRRITDTEHNVIGGSVNARATAIAWFEREPVGENTTQELQAFELAVFSQGEFEHIRLGVAEQVWTVVTVEVKPEDTVEAIAQRAGDKTGRMHPSQWTTGSDADRAKRYAVWIESTAGRYEAPSETQLFHSYIVRASRIRNEWIDIEMRGTHPATEAMLEHAIITAHETDEWNDSGWITDYVDRIDRVEHVGEEEIRMSA